MTDTNQRKEPEGIDAKADAGTDAGADTSIDAKIEKAAAKTDAVSAETLAIMPLETYLNLFTLRYNKESSFKDIVHKYLKITGLKKFGLGLKKNFSPGAYKRQINDMVRQYAVRIREEMENAKALEKNLLQLQQAEQTLREKTGEAKQAVAK